MRGAIHDLAFVIGLAAIVGIVYFSWRSRNCLNPDRPIGDRITTRLFPASARASDFIPPGWRYQKLMWLCFALLFPALVIWGATGP